MEDAAPAGDPLARGQAALTRGEWTEARAWFDEAGPESPQALEGLSWAAWWLEDVAACLRAREGAYRRYRSAGDRRGAARMALWLGDDHREFRAAGAVAGGWFRRAARLLDGLEPSPEHGWLAVFEAYAALERHEASTALHLAGRAEEAGHRHGLVDLEMFGLACAGTARIARGEVAEGMRCLDEAAAAALSGDFENLVPAAWTCCLVMSACEQVRDIDRGTQWCRKIEEFSVARNTGFLTGVCRAHYGAIQVWRGNWDDAETQLVASLDALTVRRPSWRSEALVRLGEFRRQQGRLAEAAGYFEQAAEHPAALVGLARVSLDRRHPADGRDLVERVLRQAPEDEAADRADAWELSVRAHVMLGDLEAASACLDRLRSVVAAAATEPRRAALSVCQGLVSAAAGDHAVACDHFEDAADLLIRCGAPVEAARARMELAESLLALGRAEAARRELRLALAGLEGIDADTDRARGRRLLAGVDPHPGAPDRHALLTERQVEVLRLVAAGLSDQEIAAELVLSTHTVHRHVANIYTRLDCSSRAAAVARAGRLGLL